jgi:hypothetical protein
MPEELTELTEEQLKGLAQKLDSLDLTEADQALLGGLLWCGTQFLTDQIEEVRKSDPEKVPSIAFQPAPSPGACLLSSVALSEAENEVDLFGFTISCDWQPVATVCTTNGGKDSSCVQLQVPVCSVSTTPRNYSNPDGSSTPAS